MRSFAAPELETITRGSGTATFHVSPAGCGVVEDSPSGATAGWLPAVLGILSLRPPAPGVTVRRSLARVTLLLADWWPRATPRCPPPGRCSVPARACTRRASGSSAPLEHDGPKSAGLRRAVGEGDPGWPDGG